MPLVTVRCPECRAALRPSEPPQPGQRLRCPRCKTPFTVPADDAGARELPDIRRPEEPSSGWLLTLVIFSAAMLVAGVTVLLALSLITFGGD